MIKTNLDNTNKIFKREPVLAVYEDIPQIDEISQSFWGESGKYHPYFYKSTISQKMSYVYKEKDGEVIAFCLARYQHKENQIGIVLFCVKKNHQRKGLGKSLLKYCIDNCIKKGYEQFHLHVDTENKPAFNLYTKLGFEIKEFLPNYYYSDPEPHNNAYLMEYDAASDENYKKMT